MKKYIAASLFPLLLALLLYSFLTPVGAMRFALAVRGYWDSALTFEALEKPNRMTVVENQIPYSLADPPVEKDTQAELVNWVVSQHGIFYTADYYGWG